MSSAAAQLAGVECHDALSAVRERALRLREGRGRDDGRRLGLVIEGGALRGVASGAAAVALARLGLNDVFDDVFATSAGVMNGAYFLSGQPEIGISIYHEDLADRRFFNWLRLWKVMDVDYVFDQVVVKTKPLAVERLRASPTRFHVAVMDVADATTHLLDASRGPDATLACLKAATAIPVLYNRTVKVSGRHCVDAGIKVPFPIEAAMELGCTHIVTLLSRTSTYQRGRYSLWQRTMFKTLFARNKPWLRDLLDGYPATDRRLRNIALGRTQSEYPAKLATICPGPAFDGMQAVDTPAAVRRTAERHRDATLELLAAHGFMP